MLAKRTNSAEPGKMPKPEKIVIGGVECDADDEYFQFRLRLLQVSLIVATLFTGALLLAHLSGVNDQGRIHFIDLQVFFLVDLVLTIYLWRHKERFAAVAGTFLTVWFVINLSALCFLVNNEFRSIWFFVQITVAYTILGTSAGTSMAILTLLTLIVANRYLPAPFSSNAMVTMLFSLCASSTFLHFYTKRFIAFQRRLTEANALLRDMSCHDPLTGIWNARAFNETSEQVIREALRYGTPFSALFIDLDHFKLVNDTHGHEAGDMVLKEVAACLAKNSRESDLLGRVGGEEFLMLLPRTDLAGAVLLAEKLRHGIETLRLSFGETRIPVTVSIGVARNQPDHKSIADIKRQADQAMYLAKQGGRNRVTAYHQVAAATEA
jgi:diguanylate cyclase (GGDEF)-like protein